MSTHPGSIWIDRNFVGRIPQDLWVAVGAIGLIAENASYDALLAYLQSQNVPLDTVTIGFFTAGAFV